MAAWVLAAGCATTSTPSPPPDSSSPPSPTEVVPALPAKRVEVVAPPPAFADPDRRAKLMRAIPAIEAYLAHTVERDRLVGLAAGIVIDDELVWSRGWGMRDPTKGLAVEPDTAFGIGSITKAITALGILLLRDRGRLQLDRPAARYLPALHGLVYPTADSPDVTIRHLLTHTSGLPRMGSFPEYPPRPQTREDFLASLDGLRLDRVPGVDRVYSNLGVQILGPLVDEVTGESHRRFMTRELLEPIGMTGAGWTPREVGEARLAMPHDLDDDGKPHRRAHWMPGAADAAGGLYASVEDLAAFAIYNLGAWPPGTATERGPLLAATIREAHTPSVLRGFEVRRGPDGTAPTARVVGSGLGFGVYHTCRIPFVIANAGKTMGHRASLHMLPRHGVAVILLTNLSSIHSSVLPRDGEAVVGLLADTGALQPRVPHAARALREGAAALGPLLERWSTDDYERAFSPDYRDAYTEIATRRRLDGWTALLGRCEGASVVQAKDAYAGTVALQCERGQLEAVLRVAPWDGHPITSMRVVGATGLAPSPAVERAAGVAASLLEAWDADAFAELFAPPLRAAATRDHLESVAHTVGRCELQPVRHVTPVGATFDLDCERDRVELTLALDERERITRLDLRSAAPGPCL